MRGDRERERKNGEGRYLGSHVGDDVTVEIEGDDDVVQVRSSGNLSRGDVDNLMIALDIAARDERRRGEKRRG